MTMKQNRNMHAESNVVWREWSENCVDSYEFWKAYICNENKTVMTNKNSTWFLMHVLAFKTALGWTQKNLLRHTGKKIPLKKGKTYFFGKNLYLQETSRWRDRSGGSAIAPRELTPMILSWNEIASFLVKSCLICKQRRFLNVVLSPEKKHGKMVGNIPHWPRSVHTGSDFPQSHMIAMWSFRIFWNSTQLKKG